MGTILALGCFVWECMEARLLMGPGFQLSNIAIVDKTKSGHDRVVLVSCAGWNPRQSFCQL
jgi:hypothetical protein